MIGYYHRIIMAESFKIGSYEQVPQQEASQPVEPKDHIVEIPQQGEVNRDLAPTQQISKEDIARMVEEAKRKTSGQ